MQEAGETYLKAPWTSSAVTTIKENVDRASETNESVGSVAENDVAPGNAYMWKKENGTYHTALVAGVERDDNGTITSITVNHSEVGRGYISESYDPSDQSSRWVKREHSYFKWDSKPDATKTINIPAITVTAGEKRYLKPLSPIQLQVP